MAPAHTNGSGARPPEPSTDFEDALLTLHREYRGFAALAAERFQTLHDRQGAHETRSDNRHAALLKIATDLADARFADRQALDAIGRHVALLPTKAELSELGAQVGRHQLDSVTTELRQDAAIKRVARMATLKRGAVTTAIAVGAVVIWESRHLIEAVLRIAHGAP